MLQSNFSYPNARFWKSFKLLEIRLYQYKWLNIPSNSYHIWNPRRRLTLQSLKLIEYYKLWGKIRIPIPRLRCQQTYRHWRVWKPFIKTWHVHWKLQIPKAYTTWFWEVVDKAHRWAPGGILWLCWRHCNQTTVWPLKTMAGNYSYGHAW